MAPSIDGAAPLQGDAPGSCQWLRVPIPRGHVGVWDAEQFGEHGLAVQAYEFTDVDENDVIYAGEVAWIGERAPVEEAVSAATWPVRRSSEAHTSNSGSCSPSRSSRDCSAATAAGSARVRSRNSLDLPRAPRASPNGLPAKDRRAR